MGCRFATWSTRASLRRARRGDAVAPAPSRFLAPFRVVVVQLLRAGHVRGGDAREHELAGILEPLAGGFQGGVLARPHADAGGARGDAGGIGVGIHLAALRARADVLVVGEGVHRGAVELGDHVANTRAASLAHRGLALHLRAGGALRRFGIRGACDLARERLDPEAGHVLAVSRDVRQALTLVLRQAIVEGGVRHGTRCVEGTVSEAASDDQKRADSDGVPTGDWAPSSICI